MILCSVVYNCALLVTAFKMFVSLALWGLLHIKVQAQTSTGVYSENGVPTGTPIAGDYTGALRPQIHYSPPTGFMVNSLILYFISDC